MWIKSEWNFKSMKNTNVLHWIPDHYGQNCSGHSDTEAKKGTSVLQLTPDYFIFCIRK